MHAACTITNQLLDALPRAQLRSLMPRCDSIDLERSVVLCEQGDRLRYAYFPTGAVISLMCQLDGRPRVEAGLIGAEGMLGASLALASAVTPLGARVLGAGTALRISVTQFARELERNPALACIVKRYLFVRLSQLIQTATCALHWRLNQHARSRRRTVGHRTGSPLAYMALNCLRQRVAAR